MIALIAWYQFSRWVEHSLLIGGYSILIESLFFWVHLVLLDPHFLVVFNLPLQFICVLHWDSLILVPPLFFNLEQLFWVLLDALGISSLILSIYLMEGALLCLTNTIVHCLMKPFYVINMLLLLLIHLLLFKFMLSLHLMLGVNLLLILDVRCIHLLPLV